MTNPSNDDWLEELIAYHQRLLHPKRVSGSGDCSEAPSSLAASCECLHLLAGVWPRAGGEEMSFSVAPLLAASHSGEPASAAQTPPDAIVEHLEETGASDWPSRLPSDAQEAIYLADQFVARGQLDTLQAVQLIRFDGRPLQIGNFVLLEELGRGGMGVVYRAQDTTRGIQLALKTLQRTDARLLQRLKREFRRLVDVVHPHLVLLDGLHVENDYWFVTMELVDGPCVVDFVRHGLDTPAGAQQVGLTDPRQFDRLQEVLLQIASGLGHLHGRGICHGDMKPSNIHVTTAGKVKLLDFGLAADVQEMAIAASGRRAGGTFGYLAPEVLAGQAASPAADWYAVGRTLFQLLCGHLPQLGRLTSAELTREELRREIDRSCREVPDGIRKLCEQLLDVDPNKRPQASTVCKMLGSEAEAFQVGLESRSTAPLTGREAPWSVLENARQKASAGRPQAVFVTGAAGVGKSRLVNDFVKSLPHQAETVLLRGRCRQGEQLPFRGFDEITDQLSAYLALLPTRQREDVVGDHSLALATLFPGSQLAPASTVEDVDMSDRLQLIAKYCGLFSRLSSRRFIVLLIDDLHWSDADGRSMLQSLLEQARGRMLILACSREQFDPRPLIENSRRLATEDAFCETQLLPLAPLDSDAARVLAEALVSRLPRSQKGSATAAAAMAGASAGSPIWLEQMAAHLQGTTSFEKNLTLGQLVNSRIAQLDETTRDALTAVCIAGGGLTSAMLCDLLGEPHRAPALVRMLEESRLVQTIPADPPRWEPFHDTIRESLLEAMPGAQQVTWHVRLAQWYERCNPNAHEHVATHWWAAGRKQQSLPHIIKAAQKARDVLAFDQAAQWLGKAIDVAGPGEVDGVHLQAELGRCLVKANRGPEAADLLLAAADDGTRPGERSSLRREAGMHLLRTGQLERARELLEETLGKIGMPLARSKFTALASLIGRVLWLRWRGTEVVSTEEADCSPEDLERFDVGYDLSAVMSYFDNLKAAELMTRVSALGFRMGERRRMIFAGKSPPAGGRISRRPVRARQD